MKPARVFSSPACSAHRRCAPGAWALRRRRSWSLIFGFGRPLADAFRDPSSLRSGWLLLRLVAGRQRFYDAGLANTGRDRAAAERPRGARPPARRSRTGSWSCRGCTGPSAAWARKVSSPRSLPSLSRVPRGDRTAVAERHCSGECVHQDLRTIDARLPGCQLFVPRTGVLFRSLQGIFLGLGGDIVCTSHGANQMAAASGTGSEGQAGGVVAG